MLLYDFLPSGNGYRVRLTLSELGLPYQFRAVDILRGETRQPWFVAKNPAGQIPVLELDHGVILCESTAILFFLAEGSALLPSDRMDRIRVQQWIAFEQSSIDRVISRARFRRRFPDVVATREEEFGPWLSDGYRALNVMEAHLADREYFVAERFTIADIALYSYTHCAGEGGFDLARYPRLRAWFERIEVRPGYIPMTHVPLAARGAARGSGADEN